MNDSDTPAKVGSSEGLGLVPKRAGLLIRLFARLRGGKVIWIEDFQGKVTATIAQMDAFGGTWCPVYWFVKIGHCRLRSDGTIDPQSESFYVRRWRKA